MSDEFELLETIQTSKREAQDAAENVIRSYKAKERQTRREASDRRARAVKVSAIGLALALPAIVALTAPASGVVETADKLQIQRPTVMETPEEAENERIEAALLARAHKMENVRVTYYDACVKCCGKADGITASGLQAVPYVTCAVDTGLIPLGADVLVDYGDGVLHYYRADDTGVTGGHIDVCVTTHSEALYLGVDRATVYWVEAG